MTSQPLKQRPKAGFILSVVGGVFILISCLILFPFFLSSSSVPFAVFFFAGIILSVLILVSSIFLRGRPVQHVRWGRLVVVSSLPLLIGATALLVPIYQTILAPSSLTSFLYTLPSPALSGASATLTPFFQYYNPAGAYAALGIIILLFLLLLELGSFLGMIGGILGMVWNDVQRPSAGFRLSLLAGILMVIPIPFILLWAAAVERSVSGPDVFRTYQGLMGAIGISSKGSLSLAALLGLLAALAVVASTILLYKNPQQSRRYGLLVIIFSLLSIFGMGGLWLGLLLGLLGGILSYRWKPKGIGATSAATSMPLKLST